MSGEVPRASVEAPWAPASLTMLSTIPHCLPYCLCGTCLSGGGGSKGGGEGVQGGAPPPAGTYLIDGEQKNYWRMNNSAHGNAMLSAVDKENSSLNVNSGFPHLTNTKQLGTLRERGISGRLNKCVNFT